MSVAAQSALAQGREEISARDLATLRDLAGLAVSPDGRSAVVQVRQPAPEENGYLLEWRLVDLASGSTRVVGDGGEPIVPMRMGRRNGFVETPRPIFSPDGAWITYLRQDAGRTHIWRVRSDGGVGTQLTNGERSVLSESDQTVMAYTADGDRLFYELEPDRAAEAIAIEAEGRGGFLYDRRFFPDYSRMPSMPANASFRDALARTAGRELWVHDFALGAAHRATERETRAFQALIGNGVPSTRSRLRDSITAAPWAKTARGGDGRVAWTEARTQQGAMPPLTIVARVGSLVNVCPHEACTSQSIKGLWWTRDGDLIFARGEGVGFEHTALYRWRIGERAPDLVLRTINTFTSQLEWNCGVTAEELICFYEEPNRPRRLVGIDLGNGEVRTIYDPNPEMARFNLPLPQRIDVRGSSGVESYGYLVAPTGRDNSEPPPLVIVTYRCAGMHAFLRGGIGDEYPIYPLAAQGFAVLCLHLPDPDYARLAEMGAEDYQRWSRGEGNPARRRIQEVIDAAILQLAERGVIDRDRVALTGLSLGAEAVSYALFNSPHLRTAIASGAEVGPSSTFLYGPASHEIDVEWGFHASTSERWSDLSITRNADRVRASFLLNVADHEMLTALEGVTILQDAGRAVELYVFPDEYHIKWQSAHRLAIYERNIDWLNFWLRGVENADPADASQFARWRELRDRAAH